jgi:SAM-dependent methyltransferase
MSAHPAQLLGDTRARNYAGKLMRFNAFAAPELRAAIQELDIRAGMRVLDAGCGTGEALGWLGEAVGVNGLAVGCDLATAHTSAAQHRGLVLQADLLRPPLRPGSFDLIWAVNTVNHLREPAAALAQWAALLRPGGRLVLGQSSFVPDMYFAWDARLERLTNEAVRRYYRDRYGLRERQLSPVRGLLGWLRAAPLRNVAVRTRIIERVSPLEAADEGYLLEAIFRGTWGERLRPYLRASDFAALERLCDPANEGFALRRPDFHFLQSLTIAVGVR